MVRRVNYLDEFENRKNPRYPCDFEVRLILPDSQRSWEARLIEVSLSGFRIETDYCDIPILPGATIQIRVNSSKDFPEVKVRGKIVYASMDHNARGIFGVMIIESDQHSVSVWQNIVNYSGRCLPDP